MPKTPTFSILIPSVGRGNLPLTLHSIQTQGLIEGDQIIVVGDGPQIEVQDQVEALGEPYKYLAGPKTGDWGHTQCNYALPFATADYVMVQGDDDIFLPRAFDKIRGAILANTGPPRPLMFRFYTNDRWLVWAEEDTYELGPALVGDHNIIAPNILDKLGRWETHYRGDLGYVRGTAGFYGGSAGMLWRKEIITRQRPSVVLFDWPSSSNTRPTYAYTEGIKTGMPLCLREAELTPISQYTFTHQTNPIDGLIAAAQYSYEGDKFWANLFLSRAHTGKGYGRELVQHAVDAAHENCWMEVAETDLPVLHLLNEFGFSRISSANGRIQLMKTFPP